MRFVLTLHILEKQKSVDVTTINYTDSILHTERDPKR